MKVSAVLEEVLTRVDTAQARRGARSGARLHPSCLPPISADSAPILPEVSTSSAALSVPGESAVSVLDLISSASSGALAHHRHEVSLERRSPCRRMKDRWLLPLPYAMCIRSFATTHLVNFQKDMDWSSSQSFIGVFGRLEARRTKIYVNQNSSSKGSTLLQPGIQLRSSQKKKPYVPGHSSRIRYFSRDSMGSMSHSIRSRGSQRSTTSSVWMQEAAAFPGPSEAQQELATPSTQTKRLRVRQGEKIWESRVQSLMTWLSREGTESCVFLASITKKVAIKQEDLGKYRVLLSFLRTILDKKACAVAIPIILRLSLLYALKYRCHVVDIMRILLSNITISILGPCLKKTEDEDEAEDSVREALYMSFPALLANGGVFGASMKRVGDLVYVPEFSISADLLKTWIWIAGNKNEVVLVAALNYLIENLLTRVCTELGKGVACVIERLVILASSAKRSLKADPEDTIADFGLKIIWLLERVLGLSVPLTPELDFLLKDELTKLGIKARPLSILAPDGSVPSHPVTQGLECFHPLDVKAAITPSTECRMLFTKYFVELMFGRRIPRPDEGWFLGAPLPPVNKRTK